MAEQSFKSHTKWVPGFHFFAMPVLAINVGFAIYWCGRAGFTVSSVLSVFVSFAVFLGFLLARVMALKVQDRVIRLEELLRLERLLPSEMQPRIGEFTTEQLVGLRFASDAELPDLARRVLDERVQNRTAIKRMVKTWRPDYARA